MWSIQASALLGAIALLSPAAVVDAVPSQNRLSKFRALAKKGHGVVHLSSQTYDELVEAPRNYSVSVLLTALGPQYRCGPCK